MQSKLKLSPPPPVYLSAGKRMTRKDGALGPRGLCAILAIFVDFGDFDVPHWRVVVSIVYVAL